MESRNYALLQHADGTEVSIEIELENDAPPLHFDDDQGRPFIWVGDNEFGQAVYREVLNTVPNSRSAE
jgi:hypothetical protein